MGQKCITVVYLYYIRGMKSVTYQIRVSPELKAELEKLGTPAVRTWLQELVDGKPADRSPVKTAVWQTDGAGNIVPPPGVVPPKPEVKEGGWRANIAELVRANEEKIKAKKEKLEKLTPLQKAYGKNE